MVRELLNRMPGVRRIRSARYDRRFERNERSNLFRGVFETFEAAQRSAPTTRPIGYDNLDSAAMYLQRLKLDEYDYPSLFWINLSLSQGMRQIADLGGSVGIKFIAFQEFVVYPQDLTWRVIDVPAVVARGRQFAATRKVGQALVFSDSVTDASGVDVLLASGVLQYLPQSLPQILDTLERKPRRIVVNTAPIHPSHSFFTLNSIGTAFCPYRVEAHDAFVEAITARGYTLRHEWVNPAKYMTIPFAPTYSLSHYTGFCFDA